MTLLEQIQSLYRGLSEEEARFRLCCRDLPLEEAYLRLSKANVEIIKRPYPYYSYTIPDRENQGRGFMSDRFLIPWVRVEKVTDERLVFKLAAKIEVNGSLVEIPLSKRRWNLNRGIVMLRRKGTVMGFIADSYRPKGKIKIQGFDAALVTRRYFYDHLSEALNLP